MDWYLLSPGHLGIPAWLHRRRMGLLRPIGVGVVFFLIGCGVVVLFDVFLG